MHPVKNRKDIHMSLVVFRREVAKLSDKWSSLLAQLDTWQRRLDETLPVSQQLIQLYSVNVAF